MAATARGSESLRYRREIDGLRAVALLPVTLFHAGFASFSGGFVGVDVFFVISGYLITTIIVTERKAGIFSLARFYERRARRILPALLFVMLACLPFAWAWMLPDDLENFGQSLVATTFFSNNVLLLLTSGYFEMAADFKPLAHTWSLGLEEQYYVAFPLLIALLWPLGTRRLLYTLAVLGVASLAAAEWGSTRDEVASFLLLPTRGWELLIGSAVALYLLDRQTAGASTPARRVIDNVASAGGIALIVGAVVGFDRSTPFPGLYALVPTSGAAAVILFATPATIVGRVLGWRPLVGIGLISYSGYLWQQPLFAFGRILSLDAPSDTFMIALAAASIALAYATWRLIEQPFRNRTAVKTGALVWTVFLASALTAGTGMVIYRASGFSHRWMELDNAIEVAGLRLNATYNQAPERFKGRTFDNTNSKRLLIVGDSFARDFVNSALENGYFSRSSISYSDALPSCIHDSNDISEELRTLIAQSDYMVFAWRRMNVECWSSDQDLVKRLGAKRLIVIGTKNFGWNMNAVMRLASAERYRYRAKVLTAAMEENARMRETVPADQFVDVLAMITDGDGRVAVFTEDHKMMSPDRKHLTREGARFLGGQIFEHPLLVPLK